MDEFSYPDQEEMSDKQAYERLRDTIVELDLLAPGEAMDTTLDTLVEEYKFWRRYGEFNSDTGFIVQPYDRSYEGPADGVNIPAQFGFIQSGDNYAVHFLPERDPRKAKSGEDNGHETERMHFVQDDHRYIAMAQGLVGSLNYIALVEAGLIHKPDYLIGKTNETMAKFSERIGFETAARMAAEMSEGLDPETGDDRHERTQAESIAAALDTLEEGGLDGEEEARLITDTVVMAVHMAAQKRADGDMKEGEYYVDVANELMLGHALSTEKVEIVWASYEDFRDGVQALKDKFGDRVQRLAEREMAAIAA